MPAEPRPAPVLGRGRGLRADLSGVLRSAGSSGAPAIAHAGIGKPARRSGDLPSAETTVELTYRYQVNDRLALQPDVQYVVHPASQAGLDNALIVGLRLNLTFKHPVDAPLG
ncbi:MAG: carbohydrate porin [Alphaproteobacteria bacterium]|nr:carbohydrate porin [Alphaproteobacteria bacterium]